MKKVIGLLVCIGLLTPVFCFGEEESFGDEVIILSIPIDSVRLESNNNLQKDLVGSIINEYLGSVVIGILEAEKSLLRKETDSKKENDSDNENEEIKPDARIFFNGDNINKDRDVIILYKDGYIVEYQILDENGDLKASGTSQEEDIDKRTSGNRETQGKQPEEETRKKGSSEKSENLEKESEDGFEGVEKRELNEEELKKLRGIFGEILPVESTNFEDGYILVCTTKKIDENRQEPVFCHSRTFHIIDPGLEYESIDNLSIAPILSFAIGKKTGEDGTTATSKDIGLGINYMFYIKTERWRNCSNFLFGLNTSFSNTKLLNENTNEMETDTVFNLGASIAYRFKTFLLQFVVGAGNVIGGEKHLLLSLGFGKLL